VRSEDEHYLPQKPQQRAVLRLDLLRDRNIFSDAMCQPRLIVATSFRHSATNQVSVLHSGASMPVTPKQVYLARASQEYYDLHVKLATQRVHLKAICQRYDNEIAEAFPSQDVVYALFDQITTEQRAYCWTEEKLSKTSSRLKFTGDPMEDSKSEKERASNGYVLRKLHWGELRGKVDYPSPPSSPSPPPSPTPPEPNTTDVWNTFRDIASSVDGEDSPRKAKKKVHFAQLPLGRNGMRLTKLTNKVEDVTHGFTTTPLSDAGQDMCDAVAFPCNTSSPKKRACVDDDYAQLSSAPPTKKAKRGHSMPWPQTYLFKDVGSFSDCEHAHRSTTGDVR